MYSLATFIVVVAVVFISGSQAPIQLRLVNGFVPGNLRTVSYRILGALCRLSGGDLLQTQAA